jgi:hypothetical protein
MPNEPAAKRAQTTAIIFLLSFMASLLYLLHQNETFHFLSRAHAAALCIGIELSIIE